MEKVSIDFARAAADLRLEQRLRDVPTTARMRGIFFAMLRDGLRRRNIVVPEMHGVLSEPHKSYRFYPVRDYLEAYALGGALVNPDSREGIRDLFSDNVRFFASTWYGSALARFLKPDPTAALAWLERSREHVANYGKWRLERRGPTHVILHMFDEYFWIDSAHRGGCEGLLAACGIKGEVHAELDDDYNGRLQIRWEGRASG